MESPSALAVTEVDEKLELHRVLKRIDGMKPAGLPLDVVA